MPLAPGTRLSSYEILASIGAGGMGEVYRATDTKLGRQVAVKILPAEMAREPERLARFQREARAVAALNHPNVVTLYSVEESGGVHFLTMELIEGQPLDRLISANGLPVERIVEIASALAEALAAAHEKGIVHRDLKPANVMMTNDGRVKVLDFGLAKDVGAETSNDATLTSAGRTEVGVVLGTPAYMSPEQVSGRTLDHRSDIFSLGVLLHEMSTGARPFAGTSSAELISSILRDNPPLVTDMRSDLPSDLARIIRRCLEKDPRYRVQTARDVSNEFRDLSRLTTRSVPVATSSSPRMATPDSGAARAGEGFWVAVLPFKYAGSNEDISALAEGLTEDIVTGLSRFSYLRVIARGSTARYAGEAVDVRAAGKELGARYVMEGSLRQAGSKLRLAVQLVDATSGAHLWAENYLQPFDPEAVFELQDELVPRIVATVADTRGVLPHIMSEALRSRKPEQLSPYEALLRSFAYFQRINAEEHGLARSALERAVEQAPGNADAWAILSILYREEYTHEFNLLPDPLGRAFAAARRAIEIAPSNHYGYHALASVVYFRHDRQAFQSAAERAIALNPMDGFTFAYMGSLFAYSGNWERGCALSQKARDLNPHHPGWYWFVPVYDAYNRHDYQTACDVALKVNMPSFWRTHFTLAASYGQLGELELAHNAVRELLAIRPNFAATARTELEKWHYPELVEHLIDGLRKAGLELDDKEIAAPALSVPLSSGKASDSGSTRAGEGFWVAVLPFKYAGSNADLKALADGLSEEVVTGLSRFSYLRVIARGSTAKYYGESGDVRAIGKELGARYVMEGSLRQAGSKLRLAVQLVDATTGAHLWAETYERAFSPEAVFELQDDLVPCIVSTVAEQHGILPRSMSEAIRKKSDAQLSPYEAVLRAFGYHERLSAEEHARAREVLERAVESAPDQGDCWAMLSTLYSNEHSFGFNARPDALGRALAAAQRAVEVSPSSHLSYHALAEALFNQREVDAFRSAAERALSLNRMDGASMAFLGMLLACAGDWVRGCGLAEAGMRLNPHHPGYYWSVIVLNAYRNRDYRAVVDITHKIGGSTIFLIHAASAAALGQLGEPSAQKALKDLAGTGLGNGTSVREELEKWLDPELAEHLMEGLHKAGLERNDKGIVAPALSVPLSSGKASDSGATRADEGFWVAVLPFKYAGSNTDLKALADGLSEEVVTGLSRFSYLRVIARGSTAKYSSESREVRAIGKELGARYVMEGSLRQAGSKLRVTVQLVDTVSGAHLWAETYERGFNPEAIFELQDDLVPRIVSTVADQYGVLPHSMSELLRQRKNAIFTPHEAVLRAFSYFERLTREEHAEVRPILEKATAEAPGLSDAWAMLSVIYWHEYALVNSLPASLERAHAAARRAVEAAPSNHLAYSCLAVSLFFQKDIHGFRQAAERCMELNPMDGSNLAFMGQLLAYTGEWERGCAILERASQLNPNHPGWYHFGPFLNAYRKGDYTTALKFAVKIDLPGYALSIAARAAALGQLGEAGRAKNQVEQLLALRPDFASSGPVELAKWYPPDLVERWIDGLRKAGLEISDEGPTATTSSIAAPARTVSGETRATVREDEGFWVAVLPFKYTGSNTDLKALAEGLSEEVITGLSRFSYLHVIARGSTAKYSSESGDVRAFGKELGARYVMEGGIRQAGPMLRISVQLIDALTGAHLWAETYERTFRTEEVFTLQDDLVPRIVATIADAHGVLTRTMSQAVCGKSLAELTPYEAILRTLSYSERLSTEEHAIARECAERAIQLAPNYSQAWAVLSQIYANEYGHFLNPQPESLERALKAAQRAVDLDPSLAGAHSALAFVQFLRKQFLAFRIEVEQALELNPYAAGDRAVLGLCLAYSGDWDRGCAVVERAKQINPRIPGWYRFPAFYNAYRMRDYQQAIQIGLKFNLPNLASAHSAMAAAYGQAGDISAAQKEWQEVLRIMPRTADVVERARRWMLPEMVEHIFDGWRKAGLEIPEDRKPTPSGAVSVAPSIAVLPFANMSADKDQEYFSDGLAEEIINLLAQIPGLKVIARTSAFAFRGKEQDIRGIADALGVTHVLEGSVRRAGNRLRITGQLIHAADGTHLWSERYDRELSDIFAVQDEISAAIAKALRVKLSREVVPQRYAPQIEAYEAYLKGRQQQVKVTPESLELARRYYEQAIELDPGFGMAHIGLAFYWMTLAHFGQHSIHEGVAAARAEVQRALQIDPSLADGHALLGYLAALFDSDWAAAEKHFDFPMAKQASFELVRPMYGGVLYLRGNAEEAIKLAERAVEEDPLDVWAHMNLHAYLQAAGRDDEALEQLKKVVELDPNQVVALASMVMIHAAKGEIAQALKIARRAYAVGRWFPDTVGLLAALLRRNGEEQESRSIAKELGSGEAMGDARAHALFHLICGEMDQGADWVEKAIEQRDSSMRFYLGFVICKGLRASHRWPKIAKMVNLPGGIAKG